MLKVTHGASGAPYHFVCALSASPLTMRKLAYGRVFGKRNLRTPLKTGTLHISEYVNVKKKRLKTDSYTALSVLLDELSIEKVAHELP